MLILKDVEDGILRKWATSCRTLEERVEYVSARKKNACLSTYTFATQFTTKIPWAQSYRYEFFVSRHGQDASW
jgi:hypothetical protein